MTVLYSQRGNVLFPVWEYLIPKMGTKTKLCIPPKRYYENHNGTRPMTPDVERYVRQTIKNYGWTQEPTFHGYVEEYLW